MRGEREKYISKSEKEKWQFSINNLSCEEIRFKNIFSLSASHLSCEEFQEARNAKEWGWKQLLPVNVYSAVWKIVKIIN